MVLHDDYFPSIVRLAGCWWGVLSPAGFLPLGYPAQERNFGHLRNRSALGKHRVWRVCVCVCVRA